MPSLGLGIGIGMGARRGGQTLAQQMAALMASKGAFWAGGFDPAAGRLWQDSAGTTASTAAGQPVGFCLDLAQGLTQGADIVVNGDFSGGTTGWSSAAGGTLSASSGDLTLVTTSGFVVYTPAAAWVTGAGTFYRAKITHTSNTAGVNGNIRVGTFSSGTNLYNGNSTVQVGARQYGFFFQAVGAASHLWMQTGNAAGEVVIDAITCESVAGNHGFQATPTSRPTIRQTSGLWHLQNDGGDSINVTTSGTTTLVAVDTAGTVTTTAGLAAGATNVHPTTITNLFDCCLIDEATATTADVELAQAYMGSLL